MDPSSAQGAGVGAPLESRQQLHLQRFCPENVAHNAKQLYYIRSIVTSVAGSLAGVLGLVNLSGFYLYFITVFITNFAILLIKAHSQPKKYFISFNPLSNESNSNKATLEKDSQSIWQLIWPYLTFLLDGLQEMAFGYVLWWTLWTALIHVFD